MFGKLDTTAYIISQEGEATVFGESVTVDDDEFKIKLTPGLGIQTGPISAEVDYDLAGDWVGINLYYSFAGN